MNELLMKNLEAQRTWERDRYEKALDWQITQTQAAIVEIYKSETTAFLTYVTLAIVTVILAFGKPNGTENASIPLIQLTVNRYFAASVGVFLGSVILYWFFATATIGQILSHRRMELLITRYGDVVSATWYLQSPAVTGLTGILFAHRKFPGACLKIITGVFGAACFVGPIVLMWFLSIAGGYLCPERLILSGLAALSVLPAGAALWGVRSGKDDAVVALDEQYNMHLLSKEKTGESTKKNN